MELVTCNKNRSFDFEGQGNSLNRMSLTEAHALRVEGVQQRRDEVVDGAIHDVGHHTVGVDDFVIQGLYQVLEHTKLNRPFSQTRIIQGQIKCVRACIKYVAIFATYFLNLGRDSGPSAEKCPSIHANITGEWSCRLPRLDVTMPSTSATAALSLQIGWLLDEASGLSDKMDTIRRLSS